MSKVRPPSDEQWSPVFDTIWHGLAFVLSILLFIAFGMIWTW